MNDIQRSPVSASLEAEPDGSVVVANLDTSMIHRIDRTGAAIWGAIGGGRDLDEIASAAAEAIGVEPSAAFARACGDFIAQLEELGLVTLVDPSPPVRPTDRARSGERPDELGSRRDRRRRH